MRSHPCIKPMGGNLALFLLWTFQQMQDAIQQRSSTPKQKLNLSCTCLDKKVEHNLHFSISLSFIEQHFKGGEMSTGQIPALVSVYGRKAVTQGSLFCSQEEGVCLQKKNNNNQANKT